MAPSPFVDLYRAALADLGQPVQPLHGMTEPLPPWLPRSLADLYRVAGNHPLNHVHHRLLLPGQLAPVAGKVVFAMENQEVV